MVFKNVDDCEFKIRDTNEMAVTQDGLDINDPSISRHQGYKVRRHIQDVSPYDHGEDEEDEGDDEDAAHHHFAPVPGFLD